MSVQNEHFNGECGSRSLQLNFPEVESRRHILDVVIVGKH